MRILFIEDDEPTQAIITAALQDIESTIEVEVAANGDNALNRYLENRPHDLVLTDNSHPGLFGTDLIELIRKQNPTQSIILQTGNCGEHIEAFKQKHPDIPLLHKPYPLQQLREIVTTLLRQLKDG